MIVSVTVARVGVHIEMVTTLMVGIVAVMVTGGGVGGEIVIGEGVGGVTVTVIVDLLGLVFVFCEQESLKKDTRSGL